MTTFNLYERPNGRIVINKDKEKDSSLIRTIKASSWKEARASIPADEFFHVPSQGYFRNPTLKQWEYAKAHHARVEAEEARIAAVIRDNSDVPRTQTQKATPKENRTQGLSTTHLFKGAKRGREVSSTSAA